MKITIDIPEGSLAEVRDAISAIIDNISVKEKESDKDPGEFKYLPDSLVYSCDELVQDFADLIYNYFHEEMVDILCSKEAFINALNSAYDKAMRDTNWWNSKIKAKGGYTITRDPDEDMWYTQDGNILAGDYYVTSVPAIDPYGHLIPESNLRGYKNEWVRKHFSELEDY